MPQFPQLESGASDALHRVLLRRSNELMLVENKIGACKTLYEGLVLLLLFLLELCLTERLIGLFLLLWNL